MSNSWKYTNLTGFNSLLLLLLARMGRATRLAIENSSRSFLLCSPSLCLIFL